MDLFLDHRAYPQNLAVDIEAELVYWRGCYSKMPFHKRGKTFESYLPAIKFGYDCYFIHYRDELDVVFPTLKQRYERNFPAPGAMGWATCQKIVRAVWEHIRAEHQSRCAGTAGALH